jgi:hypothetical protein
MEKISLSLELASFKPKIETAHAHAEDYHDQTQHLLNKSGLERSTLAATLLALTRISPPRSCLKACLLILITDQCKEIDYYCCLNSPTIKSRFSV